MTFARLNLSPFPVLMETQLEMEVTPEQARKPHACTRMGTQLLNGRQGGNSLKEKGVMASGTEHMPLGKCLQDPQAFFLILSVFI